MASSKITRKYPEQVLISNGRMLTHFSQFAFAPHLNHLAVYIFNRTSESQFQAIKINQNNASHIERRQAKLPKDVVQICIGSFGADAAAIT